MKTRERIINVIEKLVEDENIKERLNQEDNLAQLGMNSVSFIKLVVSLEEEFSFEFDDEDLDYKKFTTLTSLCNYVNKKIKTKVE